MAQRGMDKDARINELEARLAQQDQSILELSDEVYQQQQQIVQLEVKVRHLAERLTSLAPSDPASRPTDDVPPHY